MNQLTGIKDLDREILSKVNDQELLTVCQIDKRMWNTVCDDNFLRRRLLKYPGIEKYKGKESWKQFFLKVIYYISLMKEEFGFDYTSGDFKRQYDLLKYALGINHLLVESAKTNELPLVVYALNKGADIHTYSEGALKWAVIYGHYDIVKYLVEKGANVTANNNQFIRLVASRGRLEIVKYLVEKGADIHVMEDAPLKSAVRHGHYEIAKYLVENGADINAIDDAALREVIKNDKL